MKRDMELVRKILLRIEGAQFGYRPDLKIEGHCEPEIGYNLDLLVQAELVRGKVLWSVDKELFSTVDSLTWEGHEFLDTIRTESVWDRTKEFVKQKGQDIRSLPLDIIKSVAKNQITDTLQL